MSNDCSSAGLADCVYYVAASVDGFIAGPNGSMDWLTPFEDGTDYGYEQFLRGVGTVVMGRKTFEDSIRLGGGVWPYPGKAAVVFTRSPSRPLQGPSTAETAPLTQPPSGNTSACSGKPPAHAAAAGGADAAGGREQQAAGAAPPAVAGSGAEPLRPAPGAAVQQGASGGGATSSASVQALSLANVWPSSRDPVEVVEALRRGLPAQQAAAGAAEAKASGGEPALVVAATGGGEAAADASAFAPTLAAMTEPCAGHGDEPISSTASGGLGVGGAEVVGAGRPSVWVVGGGGLAWQLVRGGCMTRLVMSVIPVVLGGGIPLFGGGMGPATAAGCSSGSGGDDGALSGGGALPLQLVSSRAMPNGVVMNEYRVHM